MEARAGTGFHQRRLTPLTPNCQQPDTFKGPRDFGLAKLRPMHDQDLPQNKRFVFSTIPMFVLKI